MDSWRERSWTDRLLWAWRRALQQHRPEQPYWVYGPQYALDLVWPLADLRRGQRILSFLEQRKLLRRADLRFVRPASIRKLLLVHTEEYLQSLQDHAQLERILGFSVPAGHQDELLLHQRAMVGGSLLAARLALDHRTIAVNLGGGLHHALADRGQGLCVFNDVAVAIAHQRALGYDGRILVIDLDLHDGDGTRAIFQDDVSVHTFSIHNVHLGNVEATESTSLALGSDVEDDQYLSVLREHLPPVVERFLPDFVFYLAGVDVALDDRIGDWRISAQAMLDRDRFVLELLRSKKGTLPLVITLAGGYGHQAWRYSARFLSSIADGGRAHEPPATADLPLTEFRRRTRGMHFEKAESDAEAQWSLTQEDLPGVSGMARTLFLGRFSLHTIDLALERVGLMPRLRAKGFEQLSLEAELDHPLGETLRIVAERPRRQVLVELRVRRDRRLLPPFELIYVEWLLSQNPRASFSRHRPRIGDQQYPGMGVLRDIAGLLVLVCERLRLDGLAFVPRSYALAVRAHPVAHFLDPANEGRFRALQDLVGARPLPAAIDLVDRGGIRDADGGGPVRWEAATMIMPTSSRLREHFERGEFDQQADAIHQETRLEATDL